VVKPQGRRGEVAAELHTDFPELFGKRRQLFALAPDGTRRELALEEFWGHKGRVVLKFAGIDSISDAEALVGDEIQIPKGERAELEAGVVYVSDLQGCAVRVAEENGEREIGRIADVMFGAGEAPLLVVREGSGQGSNEYLIPFAEEFVAAMDFTARRIVLKLPAGMLELDAPLSAEEKRRTQRPEE
jgi:16S rRNA processing protein RimM